MKRRRTSGREMASKILTVEGRFNIFFSDAE